MSGQRSLNSIPTRSYANSIKTLKFCKYPLKNEAQNTPWNTFFQKLFTSLQSVIDELSNATENRKNRNAIAKAKKKSSAVCEDIRKACR